MNITRIHAIERAEAITVDRYNIDLNLMVDGDVFGSDTTVTFTATAHAIGTFIDIDFISDDVRLVELNGQQLPVRSTGTTVTVGPLAAQNTLRVAGLARYTNTGEGLHRFIDPEDHETYLYSQFEVADARRVFAVFEQPDLKAQFQFNITAPDYWKVISNQPTPEPVAAVESLFEANLDGASRWEFEPTERISCYITALIAGPYHQVTDEHTSLSGETIPLGFFCRASLASYMDHENLFTLTKQGFEFFEKAFGIPYPFRKYDQLFVPEFNAGAMENAGAVTYLESYIFRGQVPQAMVERRAITVLHEMAHMWFGNLVTMRWWNDLWLNESFAEFISHLAAVENTDFSDAWTTFAATEKSWAYRQDQLSTTHPVVADIPDLDAVLLNFDGITYAKGASVIRALMAWVSQEAFFEGVHQYFNEFSWSNTELSDLLKHLQKASGVELDEWARLWLSTSGINTLRPLVDGQETITSLKIHQSGEIIRPHRIKVGFYNTQGSRLVRTHSFSVAVDAELTEVVEASGLARPELIIVNDEDLSYAKIRFDEKSLTTVSDKLGRVEDSLSRALLWGAAWDMVRDAEASASWFISLVLTHLGSETNSSTIFNLLRQVSTALSQFIPTAKIADARATTAEGLWKLATGAAAGSDAQLQFVTAFLDHARQDHMDTVAALHTNPEEVMPGLDVTADIRWALLISLVAGGRAGVEDIERAEQNDPSATGVLQAMTARAAIPSQTAKAETWEALVGGEVSNMAQRHMLMGFSKVHDLALLAPFVESYFDVVDRAWGERSHEMAETFAVGAFPAWAVTESTMLRTSELINSTDHAGLKRVLQERRDDLQRALEARLAF